MSSVYRHAWCLVLVVLTSCDVGTILSGNDPVDRGLLGSRGSYRDADTLVVGRATDAIHLDPARPTDSESAEVVEQIFDKLVHFAPGSSKVEPGLAVSWSSESDGRVWTFELRRGVTFHDGTPFDADAVVFSFERQRDPRHPYYRSDFTYWKSYFAHVLSVEKLGRYQVRMTLERPYAPFLATMGIFSVAIVSPTAVARYGNDFTRHPVGTGPFRFVSWESGRIVLQRNDDYWGKRPSFRRLVFQAVTDHQQRLVALESGALDMAQGILPEEIQSVALHPRLTLRHVVSNSVTYLAMNNDYPPFDDVRVRRAVNHAINKEPIVKVLWQGSAEVANAPLPPTQWGHYAVREPYRYDPARARALLAEAARDGRFDPDRVYNLHVPATPRPYLPSPDQLGRVIQANLREVGINTTLVVQPFSEHSASITWGEHDLAIYGWVGDSGDPDNFLYILLDRDNAVAGNATNVAFFRDPEVHGLLTYAQQTSDDNQRISLYARAQAIIHEQAPWVPLAHSTLLLVTRDDIAGITLSASGLMRYLDIYRLRAPARGRPGQGESSPEPR